MSEFNLPLLRKAVEWAESEARKPEVDSEWSQKWFVSTGAELGRNCGTAYCIAGWITAEEGFNVSHDAGNIACELLGITDLDAWGYFSEGEYHEGLFAAGNKIEVVRRVAEEVARRYGEEL